MSDLEYIYDQVNSGQISVGVHTSGPTMYVPPDYSHWNIASTTSKVTLEDEAKTREVLVSKCYLH